MVRATGGTSDKGACLPLMTVVAEVICFIFEAKSLLFLLQCFVVFPSCPSGLLWGVGYGRWSGCL